jgi:putative membrane protein
MAAILISWLVLGLSVWITAMVLPGVRVTGFGGALLVAAVFGVLNWAIGWLLFVAIGVATLGLGFLLAFVTRWLVDAIVLKITDALTDSLTIKSFGWALGAALMMSGLGTAAQYLLHSR